MKNTAFHKTLAILLSLIMAVAIMPITVFGDNEPTVVSITADDVTDVYLGNGWYAPGDGGRFFYYDIRPDNITVTYSDGTTFTGDNWDFYNQFGVQYDYYSEPEQSYTNQWGLGEHTCVIKLGNIVSGTYKVTVVPTPIKSISAEPVTLIENCVENGFYDDHEGFFRYNFMPGAFTVTYNDDTTESFTGADDFWDRYQYDIDVGTNQSPENPWGLGTHTANLNITGVICPLTVNIIESPVASVTTTDETRIEGTDGYMDSYWNEATNEWVENAYFRYNVDPYEKEYTVTYKDGTVKTGTADELYNQTGHYVECRNYQSYEHQFHVGSNAVPISFMGCEGSFNINITASPVASFTLDTVTLTEESDGYMEGYWDENQNEWVDDAYFRYTYDRMGIGCTVTLTDNTVLTGTVEEIEAQLGGEFMFLDNQSYYNQYSIGDNSVSVYFMGATGNLNVHINESPISSIVVANVVRTEGTSSSWYRDQYGNLYPDYAHPDDITVYFTDGTNRHFNSAYELENETGFSFWYEPEIEFDFYNQWTPGVYNVTAHLSNKTCQYTVTLTESPVESFSITDSEITYPLGTNGDTITCYEEGEYVGEYYEYHFDPHIEVIFKNGNEFRGTASEFEDQYGYPIRFMTDQSLYNEWDVGYHSVTAYLLGCYAYFNVEITDSEYIAIIINDYTVTEGEYRYNGIYTDGEDVEHTYPLYEQPEWIEIVCADGSHIYGDVNDIYYETGEWVSFISDNTYDNPWGAGEHYATARFCGVECTYCVTVTEPVISSFTVENITLDEYDSGSWTDEYNGDTFLGSYFRYYYDFSDIIITVTRNDGTTFTGSVYDIQDEFGFYPEIHDTQSYETPWIVDGTNTVTVTLCGQTATFNVILNPYPISSVTIEPVTIIQNTRGWEQTIWDENGDETGSYYYYGEFYPSQITVTFNDGTPTFVGTPDEFNQLYGSDYWFSAFSRQNENEQWVSGTNTAIAEIGNYRTEFDVIIEGTPIASIDVQAKTMIKGNSDFGYFTTDWDSENECETDSYFYYWINIESIHVVFGNGDEFNGETWEFYDEYGYSFDYAISQDYYHQLVIGNNVIPFNVMGFEGTFNVTIIESPIQLVNGEIITTMPGTKLKFYDNFWNEIDPSTEPLGTNYHVDCVTDDADEEYIDSMWIVLYGDLSSSDTYVNDSDINEAFEYVINGWTFDGVTAEASDVNHDGVFDAFDISLMDLIASGHRAKEIGITRG